RAGDVVIVDRAPGEKRNAHGFEISRAHGISERAISLFGQVRRRFEADAVLVAVAAQRDLAGESRRGHAGYAAHRLELADVQLLYRFVGAIALPDRLHLQRQQRRVVESERHLEETLQAPEQQPGADEKYDRERDLRNDEQAPQAMSPRGARRYEMEAPRRIAPRGLNRGNDPDRQPEQRR